MAPTLHQLLLRHRVLAGSKKRRPPRPVPTAKLPGPAVQSYTRVLLDLVGRMEQVTLQVLEHEGIIARQDAAGATMPGPTPGQVQRVAELLRKKLTALVSPDAMSVSIEKIVGQTSGWSRDQWRRQVQAALGVDLPAEEPALAPVKDRFRDENLDLITALVPAQVQQVQQVLENAGDSTRVERIREDIIAATGTTRSHAALLARDQVLKLNGEITQERHKQAGVKEYVWNTSGDERVRPAHKALEGTRHKYTEPPVVDPRTGRREHPGGDYQCRCVADPVIEGFDS